MNMSPLNNVCLFGLKRVSTISSKLPANVTARLLAKSPKGSSSRNLSDFFGAVENVKKDTLIYSLRDFSVYFRRTILAGFGSLICVYGSSFVYTLVHLPEGSKHIGPVPFLLRNRYLLAASFGIVGILAFAVNKYFIWRTISRIELKADGLKVAFSALSRIPLTTSQYTFEVPLNHVSCVHSRRNNKSPYVVIKIKDKYGSYYIDKEGLFPNPSLFDYSIGVSRKI